ncbi:MAG: hypothetical protein ACTSXX_07535 [Candidatus Baldrarchaeia archaeon]
MASQPEFLLASLAFIILIMMPITMILVHQSHLVYQIRAGESEEKNIRQLIYGLLHHPGDPPNWGTSTNPPSAIGFASQRDYNSLDPEKVQRLCVRNLNYLDYQTFSQALELKSIRIRMRFLPPFNVSIVPTGGNITIKTTTWNGEPLPYVDILIVEVDINNWSSLPSIIRTWKNTTDENGETPPISINRTVTDIIIVLAKYKDGLFAPAYYIPIITVTQTVNVTFRYYIDPITQEVDYGHLIVDYQVSPGTGIDYVNVTTILIDHTFQRTDAQYFSSMSSSTSGSMTVNILSKGITFIIVYAYRKISPFNNIIIRAVDVFTWPPFVGYFSEDPPFGADLSSSDVIFQELMLTNGIPCLAVVECEY